MASSRRRNAERQIVYTVGITSLTHIKITRADIRQNTWIRYRLESGGRNLALRESKCLSWGLEVAGDLEMRRDGNLWLADVDAHTKTHYLEADTYDDGFGLMEKNARMRLKRDDDGWVCSWTWNDSTSGDGLWVTTSN